MQQGDPPVSRPGEGGSTVRTFAGSNVRRFEGPGRRCRAEGKGRHRAVPASGSPAPPLRCPPGGTLQSQVASSRASARCVQPRCRGRLRPDNPRDGGCAPTTLGRAGAPARPGGPNAAARAARPRAAAPPRPAVRIALARLAAIPGGRAPSPARAQRSRGLREQPIRRAHRRARRGFAAARRGARGVKSGRAGGRSGRGIPRPCRPSAIGRAPSGRTRPRESPVSPSP